MIHAATVIATLLTLDMFAPSLVFPACKGGAITAHTSLQKTMGGLYSGPEFAPAPGFYNP
jgi:hypothetical protein